MPVDAQAWHSAADAMAEGLVVQDLTGTITLSNPAAGRILGLTGDQMLGKGSLDTRWRTVYGDGRERPGSEHPAMLALATGKPRWADVMGVHTPSGDLIWLSVNSVPIHDDAGELTGVVTAFADITAQRLYEETRLARESRLHAAQQLTGLAWWELDLATGAHHWSDQMFRLAGLSRARPARRSAEFLQLLHPADRPAARALHSAASAPGTARSSGCIHGDGIVHHLRSWTEVEYDGVGQPVAVIGATIDVTEHELALESVADGRAKLAAALELSATAMWEWDVRADQVTWSPRMLELMGRDPSAAPPGSPTSCTACTRRTATRMREHRRTHHRHRRTRGSGLPRRPPGRQRAPRARLDRRPHRARRHGDPPVGYGDGHHPRAGVRRAAAVERRALPGRVRDGPDRHVDDQAARRATRRRTSAPTARSSGCSAATPSELHGADRRR